MVSKKKKSHRLTVSKKYRIKEKRREDARKAKKDVNHQKRLKKDPGVPKNLPFKDKLVEEATKAHQQEKDYRKSLKERNVKIKASEKGCLESFIRSAEERNEIYEEAREVEKEEEKSKFKPQKNYMKEFRKVIEASDVILEVLDARDPMGSRSRQAEELVLESGGNKRIVLILNKIDLIPKDNARSWMDYLKKEFPTVPFKSATSSNIRKDRTMDMGDPLRKTHSNFREDRRANVKDCFGTDVLIQLLNNYSRNLEIKTSVVVGVIGYPNVGKSSLINSLKRSQVCDTGSVPGVTKYIKEINLTSTIRLVDSPGVIFSNKREDGDIDELLLRNCVNIDSVPDPMSVVEKIFTKCPKKQLQLLFDVPECDNSNEFLIHVSKRLGKLKKGGVLDLEQTAKCILRDWSDGKIPFYTVPPENQMHCIDSQIVDKWKEEFNTDAIDEDVLFVSTNRNNYLELGSLECHESIGKQYHLSVDKHQNTHKRKYASIEETTDLHINKKNRGEKMEGVCLTEEDDYSDISDGNLEPLPES